MHLIHLRQLRGWLMRLFGLFNRKQREREFAEELEGHLALHIEDNLRAGLSPEEARRQALIKLGGVTVTKELYREQGGLPMLETLFQDLRFGLRMLLKHKGITAIAVLSLALGIGANTAIFSLFNALMLRMLPVKEAQALALFSTTRPRGTDYVFSYPLYELFRERNQSFTGVIAGGSVERARLFVSESGTGGAVEAAQQQRVSGNFFSVLGVTAVVGRTFTEADNDPASAQPAAVISYGFWERRFGRDPGVIGKSIVVNDTPLVIVGVTPPGFFGFVVGAQPDLWWPMRVLPDPNLSRSLWIQTRVLGRLRPGFSLAQAQAEMDLIFRQHLAALNAEPPENVPPARIPMILGESFKLESGSTGQTYLRRQFRQPLLILLIVVALVLLIACVNIANLLLARAATRRKEIAVRLAVGAGRFRLLRQLLTESVLLATIGGAAGLIFSWFYVRVLLSFLTEPSRTALDVTPDVRVLGFTLAVSVLTGLLFGLAPAWQATRLNLTYALKDQTGASPGRARLSLNKLLVVTQIALSIFLLVGAGLFVRSLQNLRNLDTGFNYENIVQFSVDVGSGYNLAQRVDLHKQLLARLEALPGARSATLSSLSLLSPMSMVFNVTLPGAAAGAADDVRCRKMVVGPRFFETLKMPLLMGRDFSAQDERPVPPPPPPGANAMPNAAAAPPLHVVINQAMARHYFGAENPLGKRLSEGRQELEVIGVVQGAKYGNLREAPQRTYYLYHLEQPTPRDVTFQLRTDSAASDYGATIQRLAKELDPRLQIVELRTMTDLADELLMQERFLAQTAGAFSLFALLLACVGLYGVMSYAVTRRTNEIGIRMALGAQPRNVVWLVMRQVLLLAGLGIGIGMTVALAATRYVTTWLYGLTPTDPLTLTLAALLMIGVVTLAGYLPARRATKVDPMIALRHE